MEAAYLKIFCSTAEMTQVVVSPVSHYTITVQVVVHYSSNTKMSSEMA